MKEKMLEGKVAIVSGASYGMGQTMAELFATEGAYDEKTFENRMDRVSAACRDGVRYAKQHACSGSSLDHDTCGNSVKTLLENGGRLIDTAYMYHNEEAVGEGVRQAMEEYGIAREEIFVITKIYPSQFDDPEDAIELALEKLDIEYIDMMLLHHPGTGDVEAYKMMERYVEEGKICSIGLSNRGEKHDWY